MYYCEAYGAWAYLVITDRNLDLDSVRPLVRIASQPSRTLGNYGCDADRNGHVDWSDVQLAHDLYNAKYSAFDTVSMDKFLSADVNADRKLDVRDAARVAWTIRKSEEARR